MYTPDKNEKQFPLGDATNRKPAAPRPVPGRKNWFYGKDDVPYYVEPPRELPEIPLCLSPAVAWMVNRLESFSNESEASHGT